MINLYFNQHKTYTEITQIVRILPCDIHAIIKEEETGSQKISIDKSDRRLL